MKITLKDIGKRYNDNWIFRNINLDFQENVSYVILGSNGSGKSTLLKVFAGYVDPSEGSISYSHQGKAISRESLFRHVSLSAPYLSLIEDFSLEEMVLYHFKFKRFVNSMDAEEAIETMGLADARRKHLKQFSTGMLQRLKIGLAILTASDILLLDEPISNLDKNGIDWFIRLMNQFTAGRTTFVCSNNRQEEYSMCGDSIEIEKYK